MHNRQSCLSLKCVLYYRYILFWFFGFVCFKEGGALWFWFSKFIHCIHLIFSWDEMSCFLSLGFGWKKKVVTLCNRSQWRHDYSYPSIHLFPSIYLSVYLWSFKCCEFKGRLIFWYLHVASSNRYIYLIHYSADLNLASVPQTFQSLQIFSFLSLCNPMSETFDISNDELC